MKRYQFAAVPVEWTDGRLKAADLGVLTILLSLVSRKTGLATVDQSRLAERAGMSRPSVCASLKRIEESGLIQKKLRTWRGKERGGRGLDYAILTPADVDMSTPPVRNTDSRCQNIDTAYIDVPEESPKDVSSQAPTARPQPVETREEGRGDMITLSKLLRAFRMNAENASFMAERALVHRTLSDCKSVLSQAHVEGWSRERLQSELLSRPQAVRTERTVQAPTSTRRVPARTIVDDTIRAERSRLVSRMRERV